MSQINDAVESIRYGTLNVDHQAMNWKRDAIQEHIRNAVNRRFSGYVHVPARLSIFGRPEASTKGRKGSKVGVSTRIAYLSPATEFAQYVKDAGLNAAGIGTTCKDSTAACRAGCLVGSGRLVMSSAYRSRIWKTAALIAAPQQFAALMIIEARAHVRTAGRRDMIPALRADGTSDLGIGRILSSLVPDATWYDYTKDASRSMSTETHDTTFSWSGENMADVESVLAYGGRVAIPNVSGIDIGSIFAAPYAVIDGDQTDARFLDGPGLVNLTWKGAALAGTAAESAGFAV